MAQNTRVLHCLAEGSKKYCPWCLANGLKMGRRRSLQAICNRGYMQDAGFADAPPRGMPDLIIKPDQAKRFTNGAIAQLGERFHGMEEVVGSIPSGSTKQSLKTYDFYLRSGSAVLSVC